MKKKSLFSLMFLFYFLFFAYGNWIPTDVRLDTGDIPGSSDSRNQTSALESSSSKIEESNVADIMQKLPLYFIENKGQVDQRVQFQLKLSGMNAYFTSQEIVYQLFQQEEEEVRAENIRVKFLGMNEEVEVEGGEESEAKVNYFIGNDPEKWVRGARTYKKVIYRELYPDIDLIVYGRGKIKHEYRVRAGGEVGDIRIKYEGVKGLRVNEEGELEVILKGGQLREGVPISYQSIDGERVEIKSGYRIMEDNVIEFWVGEYKKDRELIIDPELTYSTYLGGIDDDYGSGIAVDESGNAYVTGYTWSIDFPTTPGAFDTSSNGYHDAFITKLNSTGSALSYSTYLGGNGTELLSGGIVIDGSGNAYVTGHTTPTNFPTTSGAYNINFNGYWDAFVTKVNSTGSDLSYSTYLGGNDYDRGDGIAIDGSGNVYVTGQTTSTNFPTTSGAYDTSLDGWYDVFITKLLLPPKPDIKANSSDGPITITRSDTLSITVEFDAGPYAGEDADWWLVAQTPLGWYYYHPTSGWLPGREVTLQIPLRDLPSREVLNMSGLPAGSYTFYFGVDMVRNGLINMGQAYYDQVSVTINP